MKNSARINKLREIIRGELKKMVSEADDFDAELDDDDDDDDSPEMTLGDDEDGNDNPHGELQRSDVNRRGDTPSAVRPAEKEKAAVSLADKRLAQTINTTYDIMSNQIAMLEAGVQLHKRKLSSIDGSEIDKIASELRQTISKLDDVINQTLRR